MGISRHCSYNIINHYDGEWKKKVPIGTPIAEVKSSDGFSDLTPMPVLKFRGITLRQLRAIYVNGKRRCIKENWTTRKGEKVTPDSLNLYDITKYIIMSFTKSSKGSLVETLQSSSKSRLFPYLNLIPSGRTTAISSFLGWEKIRGGKERD